MITAPAGSPPWVSAFAARIQAEIDAKAPPIPRVPVFPVADKPSAADHWSAVEDLAFAGLIGFQPTDITGGAGKTTVTFFFNLADIVGNGDVLTNYTPGYAFKILAVDFAVCRAVTTAARRADLNLEIGTTNVTGGVVSITSAAATPAGTIIAGTAVTAANTGSASDTISIEASNVTAHAEGSGWLLIRVQNLDAAGSPTVAMSDGTDWIDLQTGAAVS